MTNKFILARKKGMSQIFREDGAVVPVTVLEAGPCTITGVRDQKRDGYRAIQLGFVPARDKHVNKPQRVAAEKAGVKPYRVLREFRIEATDGYEVGQEMTATVFEIGDVVDVIGRSKGRGFAGTIKAHGFAAGVASHGCRNIRQPGSIGQCASPSRVFKGVGMPRHFGDSQVTVKNLTVEGVDEERGLILVRGGVPGAPNGLIKIQSAKTAPAAKAEQPEAK